MIRVRFVVDDDDVPDQAAVAIGQVLAINRESRPWPRRSDDGVTIYLDAELPPTDDGPGGRR